MMSDRVLHLTRASDIAPRPVHWLWEGRIPRGELALVGGREGIGKTTFVQTLLGQLTRGELPGCYFGVPKDVIIIASEDSWEHTIVPRLMAAGADLNRVHRVNAISADRVESHVMLPQDLEELRRVVRVSGAAAVVLDPLLSRLASDLDTHKDADVRRALEPLCAIAQDMKVSLIGMIHVSKSMSNDPLTTLMASRAFAAVARAVLFVIKDPDDDALRLVGQPKNNLGRTDGLPTLAFRIAGQKVADTDDGPVWTGKLEWCGESPRSIADVLAESGDVEERTATGEASDWLQDFLTDQVDGRCDSMVIKQEGRKAGHSADALKRARRRLGITAQSVGFPRKTVWGLPVQSEHAGETYLTAPTAPTAPTGRADGTLTEQLGQATVGPNALQQPVTECCEGGELVLRCKLCRRSPAYWQEQSA